MSDHSGNSNSSSKIDYIQNKVDDVAQTVSKMDSDSAFQRITFEQHTKQDERMYDELRRMNDILQQNTDSLKEHIMRTDLLQEVVTKMDARLSPIEIDILQKRAVRLWLMDKLKFAAKIGGAITAVGGAWVFLKPWIESLIK